MGRIYFPMVPGHEIVGIVAPVGSAVEKFKTNDRVGVGKYHKLAVVGLGGLGHMAVMIGKALGAEATVLSTSERKRNDAERLGCFDFALTSQPDRFTRQQRRFDFVLDTISTPHNYNAYVNLLKPDGTMILVGAPDRPTLLEPFPLIFHRGSTPGL